MKQRSILFALVLSLCGFATAQDPPPRPEMNAFVRATGEATIDSKPDQAIVNIGVTTQATTAAAAASQNATQAAAVLNKIKGEIGSRGDIRTTDYSVNPNYNYPNPPNSEGPKIVGYTASNTVRVKLDDVALVGKVLDMATASGANSIHGIQFSVKDEQGVRGQALREATLKARASAETMASALGLKVVRVRSAETGQASVVRPMQEAVQVRMAAPSTPIEGGNVQVMATVTVTLEVAP